MRIVGCKSEKPEMVLTGKLRKDLWDDENVQLLADELKDKKRLLVSPLLKESHTHMTK